MLFAEEYIENMKRALFCVFAIGISAIAPAQFFDDFNRPNAPNLGANWTTVALVVQIMSNQATNGGPVAGLATVVPFTTTYDLAVVSVDAFAGAGTDFVAAVSGFAGTGNNQALFAKIQDTDADAVFDSVGLYTGNNVATGGIFVPLITPTASARITLFSSTPDSFSLGIDNDFVPGFEEVHTRTGVLGFAGSLGTGVGLGIFRNGFADNYNALAIPEPASGAVLAIGAAALLASRRRRAS